MFIDPCPVPATMLGTFCTWTPLVKISVHSSCFCWASSPQKLHHCFQLMWENKMRFLWCLFWWNGKKLTPRQEIGCLKYFSSNLMRVWKGRVSTERLQLCVRLSSLLPLVPSYFLSLHVALQSNNKPCQDLEAGMGLWKYSHYCTFQFQMGCIGGQRTLWWNRILTGASLIGV